MTTVVIENKKQVVEFYSALLDKKLPVTITTTRGRKRSSEQNRLAWLWMKEISAQLGDTPEEWRGYCKLAFGVPILKEDSEAFAAEYASSYDLLPYHQRLKFMMSPYSIAITRKMTTKQKTDYLGRIQRHFAVEGVLLTSPEGPENWGRELGNRDRQGK